MQWFKFYGQDWLTDTKIVRMTAVDKLLFITLLCLADQEGRVKDCDEDTLKRLTHLDDNPYEDISEWAQASGFMQRFSDNGMITLDTNGDVIIRNWVKRQSKNLTGYERVKRWREKQKQVNTPLNEGVVNDNNDNADTARIEENRIDILGVKTPPLKEVKESEEEERPKKESRTKDKLAIYTLFSSREQPWWRHKQQKLAALSLFDLVGFEAVKTGLDFMAKNSDDRYCPQAATPFEYEEKREQLKRYLKNHA